MTSCTLPMSNWNVFGFSMESGFPRESYNSYGTTATVSFVGPAENKYAFLQYIFGFWAFPTTTDLSQACCGICNEYSTLPCPLPMAYDTGSYLYPDTYEILGFEDCEPEVAAIPCPVFNQGCAVRIIINYRQKDTFWPKDIYCNCDYLPDKEGPPPAPFNNAFPLIPAGTFIEVERESLIERQTIPGATYAGRCTGNSLGPNRTVTVELITERIEVKWTNVPSPNWAFLNKISGTVNKYPFLSYPSEAVLFAGYKDTKRRTFYGRDLFDLELNFIVKTSPVEIKSIGSTPDPPNPDCDKIRCERIGIWNRVPSCKVLVLCPSSSYTIPAGIDPDCLELNQVNNDDEPPTCPSDISFYVTNWEYYGLSPEVECPIAEGSDIKPFKETELWDLIFGILNCDSPPCPQKPSPYA